MNAKRKIGTGKHTTPFSTDCQAWKPSSAGEWEGGIIQTMGVM